MPGRPFLLLPGPTNVPERVQRAMHRAMENHRGPAFISLYRDVLDRLKAVFRTTAGQTFLFPGNGSATWEAALVNTLDPGDRLLAVRLGQFSHRFIRTAERLGFTVSVIEVPWGDAVPVDAVADALRNDGGHEFKGVLIVHNETSTGVTSDVAAVRRAIDESGHPALLYVDGISSIASIEFCMDDWQVDVALAASQKGFMLPPGLGIIALGPRAMARVEAARSPRAFFDLRDHLANAFMPYTPAMSLIFGLDESLTMLLDEGMDAVAARHRRLASGVRAAIDAWGLSLCARDPRTYSDTVSAVMLPGGEARQVIERAREDYQLVLAGGQGEVAGKLFRIGHLGDLNELTVLGALSGIEMALADCGIPVTPGSGVARAQSLYRKAG